MLINRQLENCSHAKLMNSNEVHTAVGKLLVEVVNALPGSFRETLETNSTGQNGGLELHLCSRKLQWRNRRKKPQHFCPSKHHKTDQLCRTHKEASVLLSLKALNRTLLAGLLESGAWVS